MSFASRPLLAHQQRALAAAAGLVGRPRLAAGLALTLACACGPLTDDITASGSADGSGSAADSSSTLVASTGELGTSSTGHDDAGHDASGAPTTGSDSEDTLLTDAGTTLATTSDASTTGATDTGDATGTGTTGELDDCFINTRTMEVDWDCCEKQNWMPTPQCTPWGPPAPPVAAGRLQAARRARVLA